MSEFYTDPKRIGRNQDMTRIYVRAKGPQGYDIFDIGELRRDSLMAWLRSRGGGNTWAENVVLVLLGHATTEPNLFDREKREPF